MSRRGFLLLLLLVGGFVSPEASAWDTSKHFGFVSQSQWPCQQWFVVVSQDYNSKQDFRPPEAQFELMAFLTANSTIKTSSLQPEVELHCDGN